MDHEPLDIFWTPVWSMVVWGQVLGLCLLCPSGCPMGLFPAKGHVMVAHPCIATCGCTHAPSPRRPTGPFPVLRAFQARRRDVHGVVRIYWGT